MIANSVPRSGTLLLSSLITLLPAMRFSGQDVEPVSRLTVALDHRLHHGVLCWPVMERPGFPT